MDASFSPDSFGINSRDKVKFQHMITKTTTTKIITGIKLWGLPIVTIVFFSFSFSRIALPEKMVRENICLRTVGGRKDPSPSSCSWKKNAYSALLLIQFYYFLPRYGSICPPLSAVI